MINRRSFLSLAGSICLLPQVSFARSSAGTAEVYIVNDPALLGAGPLDVKYDAVRIGYNALAMSSTGKSSGPAAWEALFPGVTVSSKICIKINCLHLHNAPVFDSLRALVSCLTAMCNGAFPAGNITIFDRDRHHIIAYGADKIATLGIKTGVNTFTSPAFKIRTTDFYAATDYDTADYRFSFSVLRPHSYFAGHLSGCIKNMMGTVSTSTKSYTGAAEYFHGEFDSYVDLFSNYMKVRTLFYLSDWLFMCPSEAQAFTKKTGRLAMAFDPVALDSYAVDLFNSQKISNLTAVKGVPQALEKAKLGVTAYREVAVKLTTGITAAPGRRTAENASKPAAPRVRIEKAQVRIDKADVNLKGSKVSPGTKRLKGGS